MRFFPGILLLASLLGLTGCDKDQKNNQDGSLFDITFDETPQTAKLSELFPDAKLVSLETTDSSLVGTRNMKVIYRNGIFYIRSDNQIVMFDADGKHIGNVSHQGSGPGEYEMLTEYDAVRHDGRNEVWIPNANEILRYEAETGNYSGSIKPQFHNPATNIRNMAYVNDSTILVTTDDDTWIKVFDADGRIRREFLETDVANCGSCPIAFRRNGNIVYCPIIGANEAIVYYVDAGTFGIRPIINPDDRFVTMKANSDAYESEGMMGFRKYIRDNYVYITSVANHGQDVMITLATPEGKNYLGVSKDGKTRFYTFNEGATLENDLVPSAIPLYPIRGISCQSDTGFILQMEADGDDNPYLLVIE